MNWQSQVKGDSVSWLLKTGDPAIKAQALRFLLDKPADDPQYLAARRAAHQSEPITAILDKMDPQGYWSGPGPGYNPKYFSAVWSVVLLAQLGASIHENQRIEQACAYLLENSLAKGGQFSTTGAPSGTVDCLQGNLCWALTELGCSDPRLELAYEWMARTITGEGLAPADDKRAPLRYYAYKCGPLFACGANNKLPCAWGAAKVMLAFSRLPADRRTPVMDRAVAQGLDFLLSVDLISAKYPSGYTDHPSPNWWKFGFPVFYITDLLQIVEVLAAFGLGQDKRLAEILDFIRQKQDSQGRWVLEYDYAGKIWVDFGPKKQPNPWVTLRALKVLKACE